MDLYCKIRFMDGSEMMIEEFFHRVISLEWIRKRTTAVKEGCAVFEAFGANDIPYRLLVDLSDPARKALIRESDQKVIYSGIERIK